MLETEESNQTKKNMPKSLKTLSINFPFKNQSVVNEPNLSTDKALFDFDLVVIRTYSFGPSGPGGPFRVDWRQYSAIKSDMEGKIADINRLLSQGGLLVVVLDVVQVFECHTGGYSGGTLYTATNYDFLDTHFFESVRNGSGDRVSCDPANVFSNVIKGSSVLWTAFVSGRDLPYPFSPSDVFATNGTNAIVGASTEVRAGHVVFLPNFRKLNEDLFFEACTEYRYQREGTPPPDWISSVYLPGVAAAEKEIASLEDAIRSFEAERQQQLTHLDARLAYKKLLFEKGKHQLEPIVIRALNELGFQASSAEIIPGTKFEIDGRTKAGSVPGILETKGSKNQIKFEEFAPFPTKILADFEARKTYSKGVIVGNGFCLQKPQERLGDTVFSPHVIEASKKNSVALVNSVELYAIVCGILDGNIKDLEPIRETILTTNGYVDLRPFIVKSPFVAN